jgi:Nuclease-related domain
MATLWKVDGVTGQAPEKPAPGGMEPGGREDAASPAEVTGRDVSFVPGFGPDDRGQPSVTGQPPVAGQPQAAGQPVMAGRPPPAPGPQAPVAGPAEVTGRDQRPRPVSGMSALFADLLEDPRLPWWAWRAILSAGVGGIIGLLTNWQLGAAAAALTATADALFRWRTSAVIPAAARMTSAQRRTRRRLARVAPLGYLALHGRGIPGTAFVIDHLVIGPPGVYVIGSQRWDRRLPVRASHGGDLYHGPQRQTGQLGRTSHQAQQASLVLGTALGQPLIARPAMVIWGPPLPWTIAEISGVDVFKGRRLRTYLRREMAAKRSRRLNERQIEIIHAVAAQVLPPAR